MQAFSRALLEIFDIRKRWWDDVRIRLPATLLDVDVFRLPRGGGEEVSGLEPPEGSSILDGVT